MPPIQNLEELDKKITLEIPDDTELKEAKFTLDRKASDDDKKDVLEEHSQWHHVRDPLSISTKRILRNDPEDVYKPHSLDAVNMLAEWPPWEAATKQETEMLQEIACDEDRCCTMDTPVPDRPKPTVSIESRIQINRLPGWLRSLVEYRYNDIHNHFQNHTHHFLKTLADHIDYRRIKSLQFDWADDIDVPGEGEEKNLVYGPSQISFQVPQGEAAIEAFDNEVKEKFEKIGNLAQGVSQLRLDAFRPTILEELQKS